MRLLCVLWLIHACLDRKCVLCPIESAKGNLDRMECYTKCILTKTVEIIQMSIRNYVSFMLYPQTLKTGGMSAAHCGSFYDITIKQILMPHVQSHVVGFNILKIWPCSKEVTVRADVYTTIQSSIQCNINGNITR